MPHHDWFLVLDDNGALARTVARKLRGLGRPVLVATCDAARAALADPMGLVAAVLDVELPDGRGTEILRELRVGLRDLPVLVVSGADDSRLVLEVRRLGAEFAPKPFCGDELRAFAERVVRARLLR
ncbi:MAG: response regulator [Myxococcales bacterium]|nr:response regulator [Myxococcales bacterium]